MTVGSQAGEMQLEWGGAYRLPVDGKDPVDDLQIGLTHQPAMGFTPLHSGRARTKTVLPAFPEVGLELVSCQGVYDVPSP